MIEIIVKAKLSEQDVKLIAKEVAVINAPKKEIPKKEVKEPEEKLYTSSEVAIITKRTSNTINRHIRQKPPLLIAEKVGKSWLITETNLKKYINNEQ